MKLNTGDTKKVHLPVLIEQDEDGVYIVSCHQFIACHSYGETVNEALLNLEEVEDPDLSLE